MHIKLYPVASSLFISKDYANVNYIMVRNYITEKPFVIYVEKKKGGGGGVKAISDWLEAGGRAKIFSKKFRGEVSSFIASYIL